MSEWQLEAIFAKYAPWFMGFSMFWPVFRDFVQGFCRGLLGG
ncbi:hypothetical protein [Devosia sp. 2618]